MQVLQNCWYMFAWAAELGPDTSLTRTIAGEAITVSRSGDAHAAVSESVDGRRIAVEPRYRAIWIWLGDTADGDPSLIPDFSCFDGVKETAFACGILPTAANYELLSDNILDLSHADFLHPTTLGGGAMTRSTPKIQRDGASLTVTWDASNDTALPVFDRMLPKPGQPAHVRISVRWHPAAVMLLRAQAAPAGEPLEKWFDVHAAHVMTPKDQFNTHYFYGSTRNYRTDDLEFHNFQSRVIRAAFEHEDKPIVEAQQRAMGEAEFFSLKPVLLQIDAGPVQARRMLAQLIAKEAAARPS
jgi:phenylpropionate dioxygenase-like ring-hydroxylating dioxygenase large terminal subunit